MPATRAERAADLRRFLATIQKPGVSVAALEEAASLVASGLIDSLAVLQIVVHLEEAHGVRFTERGLDPGELTTIGGILDLIERETR